MWNLFGSGASRIKTSYNGYVKIMLDLPYAIHRCLIEPLTGERYVKAVLISRYLGLMEKIASSKKKAVKMLMETAKKDVRKSHVKIIEISCSWLEKYCGSRSL